MRKSKIEAGKICPNCKKQENQIKIGYNRSGTQRCRCKECGTRYTLEPKRHEYPDDVKELAIKMYYSGVSGRGVGKVLGMNKANVYNWIKKLNNDVENLPPERELDELYWFVGKKGKSETRENVYIITMISREPRLIVGFDVAYDKSRERIQNIVDSSSDADFYFTDGYLGYVDVVYPGKHIRNVRDKKDTHNVESVNADLRHYIPILARRSRCFARKLDTLYAVVAVFVDAYNRFGIEKHKFRQRHRNSEPPFSVVDFL